MKLSLNIPKRLLKKRWFLPLIIVVILIITFSAVAFFRGSSDDQPNKENETGSTKNTEDGKDVDQPDTQDTGTNNNPSRPQGNNSAVQNNPAPVVGFSISGIKLGEPYVVYNSDKLGGQHRACKLDAEITATAAGSVRYYWQTYHPEYFNPPNNGPEETLVFDTAGTKVISLPTYVSDNSRHFTLFITSPGSDSRSTADKVWCPTQ